MIALLAKLIPFRDWIYLALFVALVGFGLYERAHLIDEGKARETASVVAATKKAVDAANAQIKSMTDEHNATVATIQEKANADLKTAADQHDSDAQRLRDFDAYRASHPDVQSPRSASGASTGSEPSGPTNDDRFVSLEQVALQLALAGRDEQVALHSCIAERNDLTGK